MGGGGASPCHHGFSLLGVLYNIIFVLTQVLYLGVQFPSDWRQMLPQNRVG
eukprot:COSAG01_NODE_554_length_15534_cov_101.167541_8_plen_51_part_00